MAALDETRKLVDHLRATNHDCKSGTPRRRGDYISTSVRSRKDEAKHAEHVRQLESVRAELEETMAAMDGLFDDEYAEAAAALPRGSRGQKRKSKADRRAARDDDSPEVAEAATPKTDNDRVYGRGARLLRMMGWVDGDGAGRASAGMSSAQILSRVAPNKGARGLGATDETGRAEQDKLKAAKKQRRKAELRVEKERARDHETADKAARSLGRGRQRIRPAWMGSLPLEAAPGTAAPPGPAAPPSVDASGCRAGDAARADPHPRGLGRGRGKTMPAWMGVA
ncbi:hypothetical protein M885DRAFT_586519 [Pelagophyceae sp. CCMP2097]|nr:hypothetical protein M885DRAFT_586519 [Pelagophyceae sp. CCMP2097]